MTNHSHANDLRCGAELASHPGFLLAKGWQLAWSIASAQYQDLDLTPQQVGILHCLAHSPEGVTQRDLAEALVVDSATLTGMVSRLEKMELIHRERDGVDRRLVNLRLAERGRDLLDTIEARQEQFFAVIETRLGAEGVATLCTLLRAFLGWDGEGNPIAAAEQTEMSPKEPAHRLSARLP